MTERVANNPTVCRTNFLFKVPNISKLDEVFSPQFVIQEIPWKVQVCKKYSEAGPTLGIYLTCDKNDESPNWEYAAFASFKLLSYDENKNAIEEHLVPHVFDSQYISFGYPSFINWSDLFENGKNYVKNDIIYFEVKIEVVDPIEINNSTLKIESMKRCCSDSSLAVLRLKVINIDNLIIAQSPKFTLKGLTWVLTVFRDQTSHLGIRIQSKSLDDDEKSACQIKIKTKIISSMKNVIPVEYTESERINHRTNLTIIELISWTDLFKPRSGFIVDNSAILEVEIHVDMSEESISSTMKQESKRVKMECAICFEVIGNQDVSCPPCGHLFCSECIKSAITVRRTCPTCDAPVILKALQRVYLPM